MRTMGIARAKAGMRVAWLLVVVCLMPGMTLAAEDTVSPAIGDRVRVRTVSGKRHVVELVSRDNTTLGLKLSSAKNLVLARSDIARVAVSTSRSRKGKGAWGG